MPNSLIKERIVSYIFAMTLIFQMVKLSYMIDKKKYLTTP